MHVRQLPPPSTAAASASLPCCSQRSQDRPAPSRRRSRRRRRSTAAGHIEALALDGTRLAYDVAANGTKQRCNAVFVWNVSRHTTTRVSGQQTCGADNTSTGAGVRELALAGSRVAWIVNQGGNSESGDYLYTTLVAHPGERVLASAFRTGDVSGDPHGQLARRPHRRRHVPCRQPLGDRLPRRGHHRQPGAGRRAGERRRTGRGHDDRALDGRQAARGSAQRWNSRGLLDPGAVAADGCPQLGERGGAARRLPRRAHEGIDARGLQLALRPATAHLAGAPARRISTSAAAWPPTAPDAPSTSCGSRPARASSVRARPRRSPPCSSSRAGSPTRSAAPGDTGRIVFVPMSRLR